MGHDGRVHRTAHHVVASGRRDRHAHAVTQFLQRAAEFAGERLSNRLMFDVPDTFAATAHGSIPEMFCGPIPVRLKCRQSSGRFPHPTDFHDLTLHPDLGVTSADHEWDMDAEMVCVALGGIPVPCLGATWALASGQVPPGWDYEKPGHRVQVDQWRTYRAMFTWAPRWARGVDLFTREDRAALLGLGVSAAEWDERYASQGLSPSRVTSDMVEDRFDDLLGDPSGGIAFV